MIAITIMSSGSVNPAFERNRLHDFINSPLHLCLFSTFNYYYITNNDLILEILCKYLKLLSKINIKRLPSFRRKAIPHYFFFSSLIKTFRKLTSALSLGRTVSFIRIQEHASNRHFFYQPLICLFIRIKPINTPRYECIIQKFIHCSLQNS